MARLDPPLPLPLSPAQKRVARSFSGKLEAIGVTLVWREGLALAHSAPAVLVQRKTCSLALLQVCLKQDSNKFNTSSEQEMVQSYLEVSPYYSQRQMTIVKIHNCRLLMLSFFLPSFPGSSSYNKFSVIFNCSCMA